MSEREKARASARDATRVCIRFYRAAREREPSIPVRQIERDIAIRKVKGVRERARERDLESENARVLTWRSVDR